MRRSLRSLRRCRGFVRTLLVVAIVIVTLAYFNIDVRSLVEHPYVNPVYMFIVNAVKIAWNDYIAPGWSSYIKPAIAYTLNIVPWSDIKDFFVGFFDKVQLASDTATTTPSTATSAVP